MISKSLIELTKCRWREFRREPSAFFWVVFMPVLWMVVLGIAFSNPRPERYGVGWINTEASFQPALKALQSSEQIMVKQGSSEDIERWFQRGEIVLAVSTEPNKIRYSFDNANPESLRARRFVNDLIQQNFGRKDPVITENKNITAKGGRYVDFLIPGLLGLSIMSSSLFGTGMTLVSNRKENLLKRYLSTPMKKYEFLVSHVFGRFIILFFEFSAIFIAGLLIFDFTIFGNIIDYVLIAVAGAACFTAIALVCASRTTSVPFMSGLINLISIPLVLLSGVFFSKTNFPEAMHPVIELLPLTALNDALRKVALEGLGLSSCGFELAILGVYFVFAGIAARVLFKWY